MKLLNRWKGKACVRIVFIIVMILRGVMVNEFEIQQCFPIHFWNNALGKERKCFIYSSYELDSTTIVVRFRLVWFYDISTIVGYLMPNLFLCIKTVQFQTILLSFYQNFWDNAWYAIFCVWSFKQLFSSLLLLVDT